MGEFFKEHLQTVMMVSFLVASALGMYKVYVMFEKQSGEGVDIRILENELAEIVESILREQTIERSALFDAVLNHERFDKERYRNFNQNRLNQVLDLLHIRYKTESFEELASKIKL